MGCSSCTACGTRHPDAAERCDRAAVEPLRATDLPFCSGGAGGWLRECRLCVRRADLLEAVPEVGVVVTAKPKVLLHHVRLQGRLGGGPTRVVDLRKVRKAAICVFTASILALSLLGLVDVSLAIVFFPLTR